MPNKVSPEGLVNSENFKDDTVRIAEQTALFLQTMHPAYMVSASKEEIKKLSYLNSNVILDAFTYYKIASCSIESVNDLYSYLNEKIVSLFSALYSFERPVVYGIISYEGKTNLVIGLYDEADDAKKTRNIIEGLLDGIELNPYEPFFSKRKECEKSIGFISATPSVKIGEEKQKFNISALMKSLNGQNYTILFIARPISQEITSRKYGEIINVRDACFAVSKRNISRQRGSSHSESVTNGETITDSHTVGRSSSLSKNFGLSFILSASKSWSSTKSSSDSHSVSKNYSKSISDAVNRTEGISLEVQNGFALEMMEYADKAIERLRQGRINGMWETVISYSADTPVVAGVIKACISGEIAKPNPALLPLVSQEYQLSKEESLKNSIILPKIIKGEKECSPLCTALTSEELGMICTIPTESVPDFELKKGKIYPIVSDRIEGVRLGTLADGCRTFNHMPFSLSYEDLAKHTFVCGITGSGKTTTVKRILRDADVPFLVIEAAKKEYRNIKLQKGGHPQVYTLGKPEINCLRMNPFYIQCGVSPQMHIDFLKDLFSASFSFYGPMPYILEKCLHLVYQKKGWNLTLGFHPYLVNRNNSADLFDADYMQDKYKLSAHKFLFPTMQDLKEEIKRYIENELQYEGDVAGNIKTAILTRLENLCSGSKGYMFNTSEYADMGTLLNENVVFELEGLADDADKAFCVGLLVILINEYRLVNKEINESRRKLNHLLVIEEAHRLLKNVETERISEDMGNPKGKAVEHFTNMIAEMRSYGQGVIIAEQIPTKLAPDVIKNSSNKIIQRLVAADDQCAVANTIGMTEKESIYIGNLATGRALCHKEGMSLPVNVAVSPIEEISVSDATLYSKEIVRRLHRINVNIAKECVAEKIDLFALQLLNSILIQEYDVVKESIVILRKKCQTYLVKNNVDFILCENENAIYAELFSEGVVKYLMNGVYNVKSLIGDEMMDVLNELLENPQLSVLERLREELKKTYREEPAYKGKYVISQMVRNQMDEKTNVDATVENYFVIPDSSSVEEIRSYVMGR